jgi:hypothetical protein
MRGNKLHVDQTKKDRQGGAVFAKGGKAHMVKPQAAGPDKPGNTGKDQTPAPGARAAKGGTTRMVAFTPAKSARPGRTGAR